jgi:two-component system, chemotaxis family, response regulator WspR
MSIVSKRLTILSVMGGDIALQSLSHRVSLLMRESDLFGRIGGQEFTIILTETASSEATIVAERLRLTISHSLITINESEVTITASSGLLLSIVPKIP